MASHDHSTPSAGTTEGSKFKRFLRKFGRKSSDDGQFSSANVGNADGLPSPSDENGNATTSSRLGGKARGNSLLGGNKKSSNNTFGSANRSRNNSAAQQQGKQQSHDAKKRDTFAFGGNSGQGLADTLVIPDAPAAEGNALGSVDSQAVNNGASALSSPPPQIGGLPSHEPINATDVANSSGALNGSEAPVPLTTSGKSHDDAIDPHTPAVSGAVQDNSAKEAPIDVAAEGAQQQSDAQVGDTSEAAPALSTLSSSPAQSRAETSFDVDSTVGTRRRDSSDNRTMDTGKSTKPTTLMSLDTREAGVGASGMAPIAQHIHGETPSGTSAAGSPISRGVASSSIQFASPPAPVSRNASGSGAAGVTLPGRGEEAAESTPYVNVPSTTRPHPSNNPMPSGIPADNASVLTLASSTAAQSIGGAASSRGGHHHQAPSLGYARSIGGSLMGDRRNSSDTYASVKALPPLSRRGSDESTRTGMDSASIMAPSSHSVSGHHALAGASSTNLASGGYAAAGPGAPADRVGMQRTNSQRTVATQLSIPLSTSASHTNALNKETATPATDKRSSTGSQHLLGASNATPSSSLAQAYNADASDNGSGSGGIAGHINGDDSPATSSLRTGGDEESGGLRVRSDLPEITQTSPSPVPREQPLAA